MKWMKHYTGSSDFPKQIDTGILKKGVKQNISTGEGHVRNYWVKERKQNLWTVKKGDLS